MIIVRSHNVVLLAKIYEDNCKPLHNSSLSDLYRD